MEPVTRLHDAATRVGTLTSLDAVAATGEALVKRVVGRGRIKDLLSGTWLGHPLHPMLTDVPIGSFTGATVLDLVGGERGQPAADALVGLGLLSALPTVAAGAADWSETYAEDQRIGFVHAAANAVGLSLYALSLVARRRGRRSTGTALGLAGMGVMTVGGYLGGHLGWSRGVGVNNAFYQHPPSDWTAVLDDADLPEGRPVRAEAGGATVLLYRDGGRILAIGSRCSHAGGPLDEGDVDAGACTVTCPWHQSVFRLDGGAVVHGPATIPQTAYEARVEAGRVEVRAVPA
ncbi:MAG TPA: Rieske 2Fe-2S domain-containing protein [Acidimicrobiales bacterium]|nr:Rieske 2Fe-2S domain-containing protein [Acidimicrobiales bacterium]